ncbi:hypothetical protein ACEPAG_236 [Sanghuangporus baumii]
MRVGVKEDDDGHKRPSSSATPCLSAVSHAQPTLTCLHCSDPYLLLNDDNDNTDALVHCTSPRPDAMKYLNLLLALLAPLSIVSGSVVLQENTVHVQDEPVKTTEGWGWEDCGDPSDPIQIKSIEVSPDPPKPGENMTVKVAAYAQERIEDGAYADVMVRIGTIKILDKRFDLCEEARNAQVDVQCPVEEGDHFVEQTVALPKEVPRAKFLVQVRGYTVEDENLVCTDISVDFRPKFPRIW